MPTEADLDAARGMISLAILILGMVLLAGIGVGGPKDDE